MTCNWETTRHARIEVRFASPEIGYEVRIDREEALRDGCVRCSACGRVFAALKSGEPWKHKCSGEPGWTVITRRRVGDEVGRRPKAFSTRQLAYGAGAMALGLVTDMGKVVGESPDRAA